jgi:hypothetical protein
MPLESIAEYQEDFSYFMESPVLHFRRSGTFSTSILEQSKESDSWSQHKSNRSQHKSSKSSSLYHRRRPKTVYKKKIRDIDWNVVKPNRGGIVVYFKTPSNIVMPATNKEVNEILFCFGIDAKFNELTDFGGGISLKRETVIEGALREFREESHGVFEQLIPSNLSDCLAIYNESTMIIFVELRVTLDNEDRHLLNLTFKSRLHEKSEISSLVWINSSELLSLLERSKTRQHRWNMYRRVQSLIYHARGFLQHL